MNKSQFAKEIKVFTTELRHETNQKGPSFCFDDNYSKTGIFGHLHFCQIETLQKTYYLLERDLCENVYVIIDDSAPIRLKSIYASDLFEYTYKDLNLYSFNRYSELSKQLIESICNAKDVSLIFEKRGSTYSTKKSIFYTPGFIIPYFQACFDTFISPGTYSDCYERLKKKEYYLVYNGYKKTSLFTMFRKCK